MWNIPYNSANPNNPMPHAPLYVHPDFVGKSELGLYGDVIQEIDWSVGQILQAIADWTKRLG
jgi:hypothetical protein